MDALSVGIVVLASGDVQQPDRTRVRDVRQLTLHAVGLGELTTEVIV